MNISLKCLKKKFVEKAADLSKIRDQRDMNTKSIPKVPPKIRKTTKIYLAGLGDWEIIWDVLEKTLLAVSKYISSSSFKLEFSFEKDLISL